MKSIFRVKFQMFHFPTIFSRIQPIYVFCLKWPFSSSKSKIRMENKKWKNSKLTVWPTTYDFAWGNFKKLFLIGWVLLQLLFQQWSVSNFIPIKSKKFEFRNLAYIIRFSLKNDSENPQNEVTWGHVTLWIFDFKILNFNALVLEYCNCKSKSDWGIWKRALKCCPR